MKLKYVGPHDAVDVQDFGRVERNVSTDLPDDLAKSLLKQADNWKSATAADKKKES